MIITSLPKDKELFTVFPLLTSNNYNSFIKDRDKELAFIKELADEDFFNSLIYIHSI